MEKQKRLRDLKGRFVSIFKTEEDRIARKRHLCKLRTRRWKEKHLEKCKRRSKECTQRRWQKILIYSRQYYKKNAAIKKVQRQAYLALKRGVLKKQDCIICGNPKSEMHHENYDRPLEVIWLCPQHHRRRHLCPELVIF